VTAFNGAHYRQRPIADVVREFQLIREKHVLVVDDIYVQKLKAKIDEWNAEIDKLAAEADQADAESKIEYDKQLELLRARRKEVDVKCQHIDNPGLTVKSASTSMTLTNAPNWRPLAENHHGREWAPNSSSEPMMDFCGSLNGI
jgi:hypothetical protein